jgi:hypothetical protein
MNISSWVGSFLFALTVLAMSAAAFGQVGISISFGPPALPVYEQPLCPSDGYLWTPGYWAYDYDEGDYYWVPGTWVMAPEIGYLWTPGYWAWGGEGFIFHEGYWGPQVGFYGGINYGYGYFGSGYEGGRWEHDRFYYNRSVNNVSVTNIHNVYNTTVVNQTTVNRVSYNGGNGGIDARPTREQEAAARERHVPPVAAQTQQVQAARTNPQQRASVNRGKPAVAATPRPGALNDRGVVQARDAGAPYNPPANRGEANRGPANRNAPEPRGDESMPRPPNDVARPGNAVHPNDLPPSEPQAPQNTGNAKTDQKYQQQQAKMAAQQDKERQKLQQKQEQDHQRMQQQNTDEARKQQMEQQHQQQTQAMQQRQAQQQQQMRERQQPAPRNEPKPPKEPQKEPQK